MGIWLNGPPINSSSQLDHLCLLHTPLPGRATLSNGVKESLSLQESINSFIHEINKTHDKHLSFPSFFLSAVQQRRFLLLEGNRPYAYPKDIK